MFYYSLGYAHIFAIRSDFQITQLRKGIDICLLYKYMINYNILTQLKGIS